VLNPLHATIFKRNAFIHFITWPILNYQCAYGVLYKMSLELVRMAGHALFSQKYQTDVRRPESKHDIYTYT